MRRSLLNGDVPVERIKDLTRRLQVVTSNDDLYAVGGAEKTSSSLRLNEREDSSRLKRDPRHFCGHIIRVGSDDRRVAAHLAKRPRHGRRRQQQVIERWSLTRTVISATDRHVVSVAGYHQNCPATGTCCSWPAHGICKHQSSVRFLPLLDQ